MTQVEYINFDENYNNKLDCKFFTTIRIQDPKKTYIPGGLVDIKLKRKFLFKAVIISNIIYKLDQINHVSTYLDAGLNHYDFKILMENIYWNHILWDGDDTRVSMILLKRGDD